MPNTLSKSLLNTRGLSQLPQEVKSALLVSPSSKQEIFLDHYSKKSRSILITYLSILPVVLSFHYATLNQWPKQILFWMTGGGALIWWLIDLIRLPVIVKAYNHNIALELWEEINEIGDGPVEGLF